jgi:hypothetical protein
MLDARMSREHDERDIISFAGQELDELEPREPRHPIIGEDQIDPTPLQDLECLRHASCAKRRMSRLGEGLVEDQPDGWFVIDVENRGHWVGKGDDFAGWPPRRGPLCRSRDEKAGGASSGQHRTRQN